MSSYSTVKILVVKVCTYKSDRTGQTSNHVMTTVHPPFGNSSPSTSTSLWRKKTAFLYGNMTGSFRSDRPFSRTVTCAAGTALIQQSTCKSVWSRSVEPVTIAFVHICHTRPPLLMLPPVNTAEEVKKFMAKQDAQCRPWGCPHRFSGSVKCRYGEINEYVTNKWIRYK